MVPSILTSSLASDTVTTRPPAQRLCLIGCGMAGWNVQSGLLYLPSSLRPIPESGASDKSCPNHRGRTCSAAVWGLFGIDWHFPSIPGNDHSLVKLSRPGRPYSSDVLLLAIRFPHFLPSIVPSSEPLSVPSVFSILVTGTNCNVQGFRVNTSKTQ